MARRPRQRAGRTFAPSPRVRRRLRRTAPPTRLERAMELAARRYRSLLLYTTDAIFLIDPDSGLPLEVNPEGEKLLGYSQKALVELTLKDIFPSREKRRYLSLLGRTLRHGEGQEQNLRMRRSDGSKRNIHVRARLLELGEETLILGILRDLTGTRHTEQRLREKNRNLELLNRIVQQISGDLALAPMLKNILTMVLETFEADGGGIHLLSEENTELELCAHEGIPAALIQKLGSIPSGEGLIGRTASTGHPRFASHLSNDPRLLHPEVIEDNWRSFQAVPLLGRGRTLGVLFFFFRRERLLEREEIELLLNIGRQTGAAVERAELFETLRRQHQVTEAGRRELARLDRMKTNFLAMASHELRTPTTCVLAGAELLEERLQGQGAEENQEILRVIHEGGRRLQYMITEILEVSRVESQSLELHPQRIDLNNLFSRIRSDFDQDLERRKLTLKVVLPVSPLDFRADPGQLRRTLQRLVENAMKATPEGGEITLEAGIFSEEALATRRDLLQRFRPDFLKEGGQSSFLRISVRDTGVGVPEEEQTRIFEKFYELGDFSHHSSSRSAFGGKGMGLGLALVRGIVEAHDGMVWLESSPAEAPGSAFHLLFPLEQY